MCDVRKKVSYWRDWNMKQYFYLRRKLVKKKDTNKKDIQSPLKFFLEGIKIEKKSNDTTTKTRRKWKINKFFYSIRQII